MKGFFMASYVLSCCSTVDLSEEWLQNRDIAYVYFNYELDGVPCKDDFGKTHSPADLYARMLAGADAKTSQVSVGDYITHFKPILESGKDILHVTLSSGISGTYGSACVAAEQLREQYPERTIHIVDSLTATGGYGLLMDKLADLRDGGMELDELRDWVEAHKLEVQLWFFSTDLTFFVRGGRISKAAGLVGGMLQLCPMMTVVADGSLDVKEKIRTKRKAIVRVVEIMKELAQGGAVYQGKVILNHAECLPDAMAVASSIKSEFTSMNGEPEIFPIGATIGCHTGPGTVVVSFWGKPRA